MLDVFYSVDVEIWCDGWDDIDQKFPDAFKQYVYGKTAKGEFGLRHQLQVLSDHGLVGVFFVEPLFAARFGEGPLQEIVQLIVQAGHEVELHLHTEWVDEAKAPLLPNSAYKRQFLRQFELAEQRVLLAEGRAMLVRAGAKDVRAFRAGSFGGNMNTLQALKGLGIECDSSYNPTLNGPESGMALEGAIRDATEIEGVLELPMTTFQDGMGRVRHAQLGACSFAELRDAMQVALDSGYKSFMILSHNFELLRPDKLSADRIVARRFYDLCEHLAKHTDRYQTKGLRNASVKAHAQQPPPIHVGRRATLQRLGQQLIRRLP